MVEESRCSLSVCGPGTRPFAQKQSELSHVCCANAALIIPKEEPRSSFSAYQQGELASLYLPVRGAPFKIKL